MRRGKRALLPGWRSAAFSCYGMPLPRARLRRSLPPDRQAPTMQIFLFDLLPYDRHFDEFKPQRFMPYPLSSGLCDPEIAARSYEQHLRVWEEMDRLGYDGVGLNEHHTTPHGLMNSPNVMAAAAAQRTQRLKFFILGNLLPLHNPLRIAEELAMVDCLSRGRVLSGFARGVPREYKVYQVPMAESRARFDEALDIILKAWTSDVFSHEGRFWSFKDVAIWPRPYQRPHPPVWIPFTGSQETIERAGAGNFGAAIHHASPGVIDDMIAHFARALARHGHRIRPEQICILADVWVADSAEQALEEYAAYYLYFNQVLWHHGSSAPGQGPVPAATGYVAASSYDYVRPENRPFVALDREKIRQMNLADIAAKVARGELAFGAPDAVAERLIALGERHGANVLLLNLNLGALPYELHLEQVRRFARDVLPKLHAHQVTRVPAAAAYA
jgi:alkanesulfonate monooxygenase SsuD/methylene tetrahydromethanopterin reductase-like flavin-dependent oxidoreductase (luciferase family)